METDIEKLSEAIRSAERVADDRAFYQGLLNRAFAYMITYRYSDANSDFSRVIASLLKPYWWRISTLPSYEDEQISGGKISQAFLLAIQAVANRTFCYMRQGNLTQALGDIEFCIATGGMGCKDDRIGSGFVGTESVCQLYARKVDILIEMGEHQQAMQLIESVANYFPGKVVDKLADAAFVCLGAMNRWNGLEEFYGTLQLQNWDEKFLLKHNLILADMARGEYSPMKIALFLLQLGLRQKESRRLLKAKCYEWLGWNTRALKSLTAAITDRKSSDYVRRIAVRDRAFQEGVHLGDWSGLDEVGSQDEILNHESEWRAARRTLAAFKYGDQKYLLETLPALTRFYPLKQVAAVHDALDPEMEEARLSKILWYMSCCAYDKAEPLIEGLPDSDIKCSLEEAVQLNGSLV